MDSLLREDSSAGHDVSYATGWWDGGVDFAYLLVQP